MSRDTLISAGAALGLHLAVLFGLTVPAGPSVFEKTSTEPPYVEVTLAEPPPPAPEPVTAAPAPEPEAPQAVPPPPEPKPEPAPPPPKPEPVPEPEVKKGPEPPPKPLEPPSTPKKEEVAKPEPPPALPARKPAPSSQPPDQVAATHSVRATPASQPVAPPPAAPSPAGAAAGDLGGTGVPTTAPYPIRKIKPTYPKRAQELGREGLALVTVYINEFGRVDKVELKESSGCSMLDDEALEAAKQWRFRPAQINKRAVPSKVEIPYRFQLNEKKAN